MSSQIGRFDEPRVGVAAVIRNREGKIVCGLRKGSHGSGRCNPLNPFKAP